MNGLCQCGCGGQTRLGADGSPLRWLKNHQRHRTFDRYEVDPVTGCWNWTGALLHNGYGYAWSRRHQRPKVAHRVFYERHVGEIAEALELHHLCENRRCVNPEHLQPLTPVEHRKTIEMRSETYATKLTAEKATEIRRRVAEGEMQKDVAEAFGVSRSSVSLVVLGRQWKAAA